jgi:uncharacterized C2H2 Zn-finger protein
MAEQRIGGGDGGRASHDNRCNLLRRRSSDYHEEKQRSHCYVFNKGVRISQEIRI